MSVLIKKTQRRFQKSVCELAVSVRWMWGNSLRDLKEALPSSVFGPINARHPSGCRASLLELRTSCGMTCQLLEFICSYLQLTCVVVRTGTLIFSFLVMTCCHDALCKLVTMQHVSKSGAILENKVFEMNLWLLFCR